MGDCPWMISTLASQTGASARFLPVVQKAICHKCGAFGRPKELRNVCTQNRSLVRAPTFTPTPAGTLHFARSRQHVVNDGRSILDQAEGVGLNTPFGCRQGICQTCRCKKTAGCVRDIVSGQVSSAEEETIRLCVSVPDGDVVVDL